MVAWYRGVMHGIMVIRGITVSVCLTLVSVVWEGRGVGKADLLLLSRFFLFTGKEDRLPLIRF